MNQISEVVFDAARAEMVRRQLAGRDIRDARVLDAMGSVRRHEGHPRQAHDAVLAQESLNLGRLARRGREPRF